MYKILIVSFLALTLIPSVAFAGYHFDSNGGYYRDDSNDGNPYNNANYQGLNNGRKREVICDNLGRCFSS